jgi:hypothetical protein
MNLGQIVASVQRQFGDESGAQITRSDIVRWSNDALVDITRKTEVLQVHAETDTLKEDGSYDLPHDHIRIRRVSYRGYRLKRTELEALDEAQPLQKGQAAGSPHAFYVWGRKIWLFPKPSRDGEGKLEIYYVKMPDELVADQDVPEIPPHMHEDIVRYCLARAKELDESDEKAQEIMADYAARIALSRDEAQNPEIESYPTVRDIDSEFPGYTGYGGW